ncbi:MULTISPECIES: hypothetical protein [Pseudomonas]|uniref:hypothetical protein n=1 Tax=Pseudomonas TaxID=286 RepID=UPI000FC4396B|nr:MULTISPECIES: hypothetical protein [Pseudomonas]RUE17064.1 hypothetical protein IPC1222_25470 [Pseudomonas aeruginosa]CAH0134877.1 hypothetical protein SRABI111_00311 [Pseudomonas carnis]CAH0137829.1 hypothetical protein SRABI110_00455 [Pseudomonas carnis]CAH0159290.1 hypothetical protein SRABI64_00738 [Pseudomonas carnis]CAH0200857.1 hypothetical protein SRABI08_01889 [Pseudomonas carnis]
MKVLSIVQVLLLAVQLTVRESIRFIATSVLPVVLTGTLAFMCNSIIYSMFGYLVAIPFTALFAYTFYFLISLAVMSIYCNYGNKKDVQYGITDEFEIVEIETDDVEVAK